MEYGKIISVTGMGGLFELVGSKKDGAIVKSLEDKTTKFVSSRIHNFSHLESIEVYTVRDNVNLVELLQAMDASQKPLPDQKDASAIKAYFMDVYPDMDFERVYASDMKKMVKWYTVLKENEVELKLTEVEEDEEDSSEAPEAEEAPEAPKKQAKAKATESDTEAETSEPAKSSKAKAATESKPETGAALAEEQETAAPKKRAPRKKKTEE